LWVKSLLEHGSWLHNPTLGAPFGFDGYDFPSFDGLHLILIRVMGMFSRDHVLLFNLYTLLAFPLVALTMFLALRQLRIGVGSAGVATVLSTFLPFHLLKGRGPFFRAAFWQVPLALLVLLWVAQQRPPLFVAGPRRWPRLDLRARRSWGALVICAVIGT